MREHVKEWRVNMSRRRNEKIYTYWRRLEKGGSGSIEWWNEEIRERLKEKSSLWMLLTEQVMQY